MDLLQLYISSQSSSATIRQVVSKKIREFNKQQRSINGIPFDPLLPIRDNLPGYYDYLINNIEDYAEFCYNFDYRVLFDTAVGKFNSSFRFYNYLTTVHDFEIPLYYLGIPLQIEVQFQEYHQYHYLNCKLDSIYYYYKPSDLFNIHT